MAAALAAIEFDDRRLDIARRWPLLETTGGAARPGFAISTSSLPRQRIGVKWQPPRHSVPLSSPAPRWITDFYCYDTGRITAGARRTGPATADWRQPGRIGSATCHVEAARSTCGRTKVDLCSIWSRGDGTSDAGSTFTAGRRRSRSMGSGRSCPTGGNRRSRRGRHRVVFPMSIAQLLLWVDGRLVRCSRRHCVRRSRQLLAHRRRSGPRRHRRGAAM